MSTTQSNSLVYTTYRSTKTMQYDIEVSLRDECKNGHQDFHITGTMWPVGKPKTDKYIVAAWSIGDRIAAAFPEFAIFDRLHGCDYLGQPMYAVANSLYHLKTATRENCLKWLRITESEYEALKDVHEEGHLAILLIDMGIRARWKSEADKAIAQLEEWTGKAFLCDSKRTQWGPDDAKMVEFRELQSAGYYSPAAAKDRRDAAKAAAFDKRRQELKEGKEKAIEKITTNHAIKLAVLDAGHLCTNFIYYDHTNQVRFNWQSYGDKFTEDQVSELMPILQTVCPGLTLDTRKD